jgi:hypothetical protein
MVMPPEGTNPPAGSSPPSGSSPVTSSEPPEFGTPEYTDWYYNDPAGPGYMTPEEREAAGGTPYVPDGGGGGEESVAVAPGGASPVGQPSAPQPEPSEPSEPEPITKTPSPDKRVEVISSTSGKDKYIVKVDGVQKLMSESEINAAGGELPEVTRLQNEVSQAIIQGETPEKAYEKVVGTAEASKLGLTLDEYKSQLLNNQDIKSVGEYIQRFAEKYGVTLAVAAQTLQRYNDNPDDTEFASLNKWVKEEMNLGFGTADDGTKLIMQYAQNHAWDVVNNATKKNPKILTTVWEDGQQTNVLNLGEAAKSGIADPDVFNLIGQSTVRTRVKTSTSDPGTLFVEGGFGGFTNSNLAEIKEQAETEDQINEIMTSRGITKYSSFDQMVEAGLMPKEFKKLGYDVTLEDIIKTKNFITNLNDPEITPPELKKIYDEQGAEKYNEALVTYQDEQKQASIEFDRTNVVDSNGKYMSMADFTNLVAAYPSLDLLKIVKSKGFDEAERLMQAEDAKQAAALSSLSSALNKDGSYDFDKLASFARTHENANQTFQEAGFVGAEKLVKEIDEYNNATLGLDEYARRYFLDKNIEPLSRSEEYRLSFALEEAVKQPDGTYVSGPQAVRIYEVALKNMRAEYKSKFGTGAEVGTVVAAPASFIFPPARALRPDVKLKDISGAEWGIGVVQLALLATPAIGGVVGKIAGVTAGKIAGLGVTTAVGGVFTKQTVENWGVMSPEERALSVAMDVLILGSAVKGAFSAGKMPALESAKSKIDSKITENTKPQVTVAERAYGAGHSAAKTIASTPEIIKQVAKDVSRSPQKVKLQVEALAKEIANNTANKARLTRYIASDVVKTVAREVPQLTKATLAKIEASIRNYINSPSFVDRINIAIQDASYKAGNIIRLTPRVAKDIIEAVRRGVPELSKNAYAKVKTAVNKYLNSPSVIDKVDKIIIDSAKRSKYEIEGFVQTVQREIPELSRKATESTRKAISNYLNSPSVQDKIDEFIIKEVGLVKYMATDLSGTILRALPKITKVTKLKLQVAVRNYINSPSFLDRVDIQITSAAYKTGNVLKATPQAVSDFAVFIQREVPQLSESALNKTKATYTQWLNSQSMTERLSNRIKIAIKERAAYIKEISSSFRRGILDGTERAKTAGQIKAKFADLGRALDSKDVAGVKEAGEGLQAIGKQIPKEQGGEVIARQGKQIAGRAAEIVKIAEKRLTVKQQADLTERLGNNTDFIESPGQKVVAEYQRLESDIAKTRKQVRDNESFLTNTEVRGTEPRATKSNLSKAEIEAEKVRLTKQINQDTNDLNRMRNQGGEPLGIQRLYKRISEAQADLSDLNVQLEVSNTGRLRQHARDEIKSLNKKLAELSRKRNELLASDEATELWGTKITGQEPREPLERGGGGPEKGSRVGTIEKVEKKVEVKPKTDVKEKIKQVEPDTEKLKKAKEKVEQERKVSEKTKPAEKQKTKTATHDSEIVTVPQQIDTGRWAIVWDDTGLGWRWVVAEPLKKGFITEWVDPKTGKSYSAGSRSASNDAVQKRFEELLSTMTREAALKKLAEEYPDAGNYPLMVPYISPSSVVSARSAQVSQTKRATEARTRTDTKTDVRESVLPRTEIARPYPQPVPKPKPRPVLEKEKIKEKTKRKIRTGVPFTDGSDGDAFQTAPNGSITWKQGTPRGGEVWKYIPPPWNQKKPLTLRRPPRGAVRTNLSTPEETIQVIGRSKVRVPKTASIDLGVTDIIISNYGRKIDFKGRGQDTDVGKEIPSNTKGMSVPAEEGVTGVAYISKSKRVRYSVTPKNKKKSGKSSYLMPGVTGMNDDAIRDITGI